MRLIDADLLYYEDIECTDGNTYMVVHSPEIDNAEIFDLAEHDKQIVEQTIDKCIQIICLMGFENLAFNDVKVVQALERLKESEE